ncbi:MAG: NAD(P)H-quinone oxidoreductase subunit 3 [Crenarchaeota archaeon]|nr:NAD(P)H-quinone oxidoreductase subunit 3 [Thermoproteota archaeon]
MIWFLIYAVLCVAILVIVLMLGLVISRRYGGPRQIKSMRFEAGNPPMDKVRKKLIMQYFGYVFMAVCLECVTLYFLVLSACRGVLQLVSVLAPCLLLLALAIVLGLRYVTRLEEWL